MSKRAFLPHIEFLRAFAILLVVFTHVNWPLESTSNRILYTFFQNGTVLFLFIAGFLFTFLNPTLDYADYLGKKLRNVICPYLVLSAFFISLQIFVFHSYAFDLPTVATMVIQGAPIQNQYWFIPMIALFYLSAPLFHLLASRRWGTWLLALTVPLSILTWRSYGQLNPLLSYVHFFGIYHFGAVAGSHREAFDRLTSRWGAIATSAAVFLCAWRFEYLDYFRTNNAVFEDLFRGNWAGPDISILQKLSLLVLVYGLSFRFVTSRHHLVRLMAEYSFGIFFLHLFFINLILVYWADTGATWICLSRGAVSLGLSLITIYLIKKLAGKNSRYIVGC